MIEFFANIMGVSYKDVIFRYENNTKNDPSDDIFVRHPQDRLYLPEASQGHPKSPEMEKYERYAKKSKLLKKFMDNSPAGIAYFQDPYGHAPFNLRKNIGFQINYNSVTGGSSLGGGAELNPVTIP